jgi:hypothetical protein
MMIHVMPRTSLWDFSFASTAPKRQELCIRAHNEGPEHFLSLFQAQWTVQTTLAIWNVVKCVSEIVVYDQVWKYINELLVQLYLKQETVVKIAATAVMSALL